MSTFKRLGILPWILIAIVLGIICAQFFPIALTRVFVTFNDLFSQFLGFAIPLIIVALIVPAIVSLGKGAGKWLGVTAAIAYTSSIFAGFLTFFGAKLVYPQVLTAGESVNISEADSLTGYIAELQIPPVFGVMTALVLSFVVGIGLSLVSRGVLRKAFIEFREIINALISKVIIPLLPIHIFGIFLNFTETGNIWQIVKTLLAVVVFVLVLEVLILGTQYGIAGTYTKVNPVKALGNMMPAYFTALGTSSSAATIPVTLRQAIKNGVSEPVASFVIPLCATIHLAGSMSKITAFAMAIIVMNGLPVTNTQLVGFIFMLAIIMVAAPGVPGGAIMASVGVLQSMLGFDDASVGLMIASYIALDSFGTATNVTGDGAIALVMHKMTKGDIGELSENAAEIAGRNEFDGQKYLESIN